MSLTKPSHNDLQDNGTLTHAELEESIASLTGAIGTIGVKVLPIGPWNITSVTEKDVAHGLDHTKIRGVIVEIIADDGRVFSLGYESTASIGNGYRRDDTTNITIQIGSNGFFVNAVFDDAVMNRGWVTIFYVV